MKRTEVEPEGSPPTDHAALRDAVNREEERVARLEAERGAAVAQLAELRAKLAATEASPAGVRGPNPVPLTPTDKVRLFRQLFRGRDDVYPIRFVSKKSGKAGYAPDCSNKFVPGVCGLPKVKCGDCTRQAFRPVDDAAVLAHLKGRHVMGIYAMREDETCWFLAVDFDKSTWMEDTKAFVATSRRLGLPLAVERSRSGNGAHVWFFFSAPVPAVAARKMGCHLLTETMAERHELSMDSYDRLFPSQDTLPRGGFGNLIALPLQYESRKNGNSVFLDDDLVPLPDDGQWAYLASIARISPEVVERIAAEATRTSSVVGLHHDEEADEAPWTRTPSRKPRAVCITGPLPGRVRAVLSQSLFVDKTGLPSPLLNQLKRLAAFQNPEFYKKQTMRLSTALTPRVINCAEDLPHHVALPRGCRTEAAELLRDHGIILDVDDQRTSGARIERRFAGSLTKLQQQAVAAIVSHDTGVLALLLPIPSRPPFRTGRARSGRCATLKYREYSCGHAPSDRTRRVQKSSRERLGAVVLVAPPGIGKTVVGTFLVAVRACSTLVLVHRRPLLEQWVAQLSAFLGIDAKETGQIGAGKRSPTGLLDVAMIQSLVRGDVVADLVANYGHVIVDECHHVPAVSFERVLSRVRARYIVGLTATPERRDGHQAITSMQLGPVRFAVDARAQAGRRPFEHLLFARETAFRLSRPHGTPTVQEIYAAIASDADRNELILNDVIGALEEGRSPILLTERRDHLDYFAHHLEHATRHVIILQGGMRAKVQREVRARFEAIPPHEERLVLATGRYVGEGFDDARLDTLFLAMPVSWKGTLVQYTGRLHRLHPAKRDVRIYDYVDREVPMLMRMFEKRLRGYRAIGYAPGEAPLGYADPSYEHFTRYDDDEVAEEFATDEVPP